MRGGVLVEKTEELKAIVSELMKVSPESLNGDTVLGGVLATSLGRARLDAKLRSAFGLADAQVYTIKTFGQLCQLSGTDSPRSANASTSRPPAAQALSGNGSAGAGIQVGMDIQSVAALPEANDYWEGDFYQQHYSRQEIAYALLQPDPRESFAAAWCAKEALRKADSRWTGVDWQQIELWHDTDGRPSLRSGDAPILCSVSLSHSHGMAAAVVVIGEASPQPAPVATATPVASTAPASSSKLPIAVAIIALLISLATATMAWMK